MIGIIYYELNRSKAVQACDASPKESFWRATMLIKVLKSGS